MGPGWEKGTGDSGEQKHLDMIRKLGRVTFIQRGEEDEADV